MTVCDYNVYVKSLLNDLHCAMTLAQKNCTAEQGHQRDQYNKRVKGQSLSLGDQVLLANKGVKGKSKLSDKWQPTVYTIVAAKPALHIYRIRDREGNERVVHRNLLLQVNFLPLAAVLDEDDALVSTPASSVVDDPLPPDCDDTETLGSDSAAATANPSLAGSLSSVDDWDDGRTTSWVQDQLSFEVPPCPVSPPLSPVVIPLSPPRPTPACSDLALVSNVEGRLTSRFGRVIRRVCRLIESMTQLESVLGVEPSSGAIIHA